MSIIHYITPAVIVIFIQAWQQLFLVLGVILLFSGTDVSVVHKHSGPILSAPRGDCQWLLFRSGSVRFFTIRYGLRKSDPPETLTGSGPASNGMTVKLLTTTTGSASV
ncbi:hypothetical protein [Erwinia sp. E_sp_B04_7]|uniref:hypothetical protein n=1 Tax=unclassified Erwinia TaxID=2622719 RepID=UPI0030D2EBEA